MKMGFHPFVSQLTAAVVCLLVWKMFVKKRELGREEEKKGGHANEAGVGKRARGGTKAFIVPSLLRHTSYQPTRPRIEWPVWALKRGFVRIHPDFQNVFTIKFQTLGFPKSFLRNNMKYPAKII